MKKNTLFLFLAISCSIISTILLTLPGSEIPKEDWLDNIRIDKWVHISMFATLAYLWCMALPQKNRRTFYAIGVACLLYGIIMEFIQKYFIPNRSFDVWDIVADGAGVILGVFISIRRYRKK